MVGLGAPEYIGANPVSIPNAEWLASTLNGIFSSMISVGGLLAIILDQILPGTKEERGVDIDTNIEDESNKVV
ncbi:hypothetical protein FH966_02450 [Lentibacillus cibarius]|uniref:Uncharacterized protein n=1 Tax=Lentibacillus cibarius TaxID=2583219 RepID=A0A549YFK2_9BACI|nr:hypothetical protein [Lentibacillus cibarius]TRM10671.1 hypothetical protein FH966_02450 [Lentibacillus cibarius]